MSPSLLVIAGEVSGDMHAAAVVRELRRRDPGLHVWGVGGDRLREEGAELLYDARDMAVMGLPEVLRKYGFFKKVFRHLVRETQARRPDGVLLVDYPGFNLRFAAAVHGTGPRVFYYVCPQVWAWHRSRIPQMARIIDRLLVIFPFEKAVFQDTALAVDFVGHPLVDEAEAARREPPRALPWNGRPRVALLPGSRRQEIERIFPALWRAAELVDRTVEGAAFLIAAASETMAALIRAEAARLGGGPARWEVVVGATRAILRQADAAWVASGTATIEACLMRCPMLVVYRTAALTYWLGRKMVKVPHIGMVNIVAGRAICPEYIQGAATPSALAEGLRPLLDDTPARRAMVEALEETAHRLGEGGAAARAAALILDDLEAPAPAPGGAVDVRFV